MDHENFEDALSLERFGRYLAWAGGDRGQAIALYGLNTRLSESLYTPLQTLEVALRNRIHTVLAEAKGGDWYRDAAGVLLVPHQSEQVAKAIQELAQAGKPITPGGVVASLTFSFWTTMFNKDYETLWQQTLHRIAAPNAPKGLKRKSFSGALTPIRVLRNRIAHHEPIIGWNLSKHHAKIMELIDWLSPSANKWCCENDRFPLVYPRDGIVLAQLPDQVELQPESSVQMGLDATAALAET
ncbi:Abi family protein [Lysobacter enzymogenes]|uniref:Abi family protein n=1 Tax=Lysobacter enzymogenes TaxID=69 RepID=UPI0037481851